MHYAPLHHCAITLQSLGIHVVLTEVWKQPLSLRKKKTLTKKDNRVTERRAKVIPQPLLRWEQIELDGKATEHQSRLKSNGFGLGYNSKMQNVYWPLKKDHWSLIYSTAPPLLSKAPRWTSPSLRLCPPWLRSLSLWAVTDKMCVWMYANVIFVVHYFLKDRNGTISFPFYETAVLTSGMEVQ